MGAPSKSSWIHRSATTGKTSHLYTKIAMEQFASPLWHLRHLCDVRPSEMTSSRLRNTEIMFTIKQLSQIR